MSDSDKWSVIIFPWQLTSPGCFRTVLWSWLGSSSWSLLRLSKVMEKILLFIEINWSSELSAVSFFWGGTLNRETRINLGHSFVFGANIRVRDLGGQVVQLSAHLRGAEPHSFQAQPSKWKYKSFGRCLKQKYSIAKGRESDSIAATHYSIHISVPN